MTNSTLTIEAMRLGVVPRGELDAYTVGRRAELGLVEADLSQVVDDGGAVRAFLGGYGTGKTHLLELIGRRGLEQNFLVAHAVLDPEETAPSHPKRVFRELVRSLEYPDRDHHGERSLQTLFERALGSDEARRAFCVDSTKRSRELFDEGAHLYWTPALRYFGALTGDEALVGSKGHRREASEEESDFGLGLLFDWVEGHPTISNMDIDDALRRMVGRRGRIFSMKDYRPWSRIYGYLLSGLAAMARLSGYAGLVVLVDEAEFYSLLSSQNREYARILFKALAWASVGGGAGMLPFSRDELDLGGLGILQDLPPQYAPPDHRGPGLYTVFAMTPNTDGLEALGQAVPDDAIAELGALALDDYRELVARVFDHYRRATDGEIDERIEAALARVVSGLLGSGYIENPRQAMKFVVEFLDIAQFRPDSMKQVVGDLRAMYG